MANHCKIRSFLGEWDLHVLVLGLIISPLTFGATTFLSFSPGPYRIATILGLAMGSAFLIYHLLPRTLVV